GALLHDLALAGRVERGLAHQHPVAPPAPPAPPAPQPVGIRPTREPMQFDDDDLDVPDFLK
ncbi:hypothetical protein ABLM29_11165, partial [Nocardioides sp. YIM 152588]